MPKRRGQSEERPERAGLYVRVSLDRSAKGMQEEIVSPETQEDRARAYCVAQGWIPVLVERDIDESAYRQHYTKREGLMRLLQAAEAGDITKIVVWKFSRLSRRLKEFLEICDRVEAAGGGIVSITEQVDTSTPAGRLIRNILASFAQFQSEELGEQIFETWVTLAKQGRRPAGLAPFGTVNERGILKPHPETHAHLLAMYRLFAETTSLRAVWDYLVANRVPPPKASEWNVNTIRHILSNPIYVGRIQWAGEEYQARWDPLVPPELWQEVQDLLARRRTRPLGRRDAHMLTGIIRCGACGRPMWTKYQQAQRVGQRLHRRVYACISPTTYRRRCDTPFVDAEEAEAAVWEAVKQLLAGGDLDAMVEAAVRATEAQVPDDVADRRRRLLAERERVERAVAQLFDLLADGTIDREQFREQNKRYLERIRALQAELEALPEATPAAALDPAAIRRAAALAMTAATTEERRRALLDLGAEVVVRGRKVSLQLLGLEVNLRAVGMGETLHFGPEYHRQDYQGPVLTDKQVKFLRRTYAWADKQEIARRLGRSYATVVTLARKHGLAPKGRGRWPRRPQRAQAAQQEEPLN